MAHVAFAFPTVMGRLAGSNGVAALVDGWLGQLGADQRVSEREAGDEVQLAAAEERLRRVPNPDDGRSAVGEASGSRDRTAGWWNRVIGGAARVLPALVLCASLAQSARLAQQGRCSRVLQLPRELPRCRSTRSRRCDAEQRLGVAARASGPARSDHRRGAGWRDSSGSGAPKLVESA